MPNFKDHVTRTGPSRPGLGSELRQLKTNGEATTGELREFLGTLRGRSPQEVLGAVAQSGLTRSIVIATIGFVVVLAVFTVVPYGYHTLWPEQAVAAASDKDADTSQTPDEAPVNPVQPAAANPPTDDIPAGAGDLPGKLGIGETKSADPGKNPLDSNNKIDKLLDGID